MPNPKNRNQRSSTVPSRDFVQSFVKGLDVIRAFDAEQRLQLLYRRRHPNNVEIQPPHERPAVRRRRGGHAVFRQLRLHKRINRIGRRVAPRRCLNREL